MNKLQKKNLLVEVNRKPFIIRHGPNEKHNEITIAIVNYAIPMENVTKYLTAKVLGEVQKMTSGYPNAGISFNFKPEAPAFVFTCKGKTERRGNDTPNQELADKIALAKCRAKACIIGRKIMIAIAEALKKEVEHIEEISGFFNFHSERELAYIQKA